MTQGLTVRLPTSDFGFNEGYYLAANPDVAALVQQGVYPSGRAHYEELGRLQGRTPIQGGNTGAVLPRGIQRWRQAVNGDSPLMPLGTGSTGNPFVQPPAVTPDAGANAAATSAPALGGGNAYGYQHDGQGGYSNNGMNGSEVGGPSGSTATGGQFGLGKMGSMIGTGLSWAAGVPFAGMALGALGNAVDANAANSMLEGRVPEANKKGVSMWDAIANGLTFGLAGQSVKDQVGEALEQQREYDRAVARSPSVRDAIDEARENLRENSVSELSAAETAASNAAAAEASAKSAAASETAGMDFGGGSGTGTGTESGGGQGGMTGDRGDPGDGGDFAFGGRIRRFASGGLNIQPWDTINADIDKRGLTSASAYESTGMKMALGGVPTQPGSNPIHAALGTQVRGPGDGRSDDIPAMLSNDEYVIPADVVAALGDGSSNAGAKKLADLVVSTRARYRKKLGSLPPPKA